MVYSTEVQHQCPLMKGCNHGPAPIPEEGKWVQAKQIKDISGYTHGVGWCAPQQGACKLSLNVKNGVIEEALVETIGCSGMTHSAAMASEILVGKTILEALNTDLVCDAINTAMRAGLEDLGKGLRSMVGTMYATKAKGPRYLEMTEGYCTRMALNKDNEVIGYEFVSLGKLLHAHGSQQGQRGDRLRVRLAWQDDRLHQEGHDPERGVGEGQGPLRTVRGRRQVH